MKIETVIEHLKNYEKTAPEFSDKLCLRLQIATLELHKENGLEITEFDVTSTFLAITIFSYKICCLSGIPFDAFIEFTNEINKNIDHKEIQKQISELQGYVNMVKTFVNKPDND